jgi:ferredoxin
VAATPSGNTPGGVLSFRRPVRRIDDADFAKLGVLGKLKRLAHRRQTAYTPRLDACRACGQCVAACPEHAITMRRG